MMKTRSEQIQKLQENSEVDVLIIGGGINGIGTFRDLALQGLRVLLAEKGDFGSGASAASSHMLHGGIRYLENGEFRLVREALHERNLLLKNAPHYAKPLPTTIPIFRWFSGLFNAPLKFLRLIERPAERGGIVIKLGLMMYDWFTGPQQSMPFHKVMLRKSSLEQFPRLNNEIVCTATYYDAWMPYPERLCLELIQDAEADNPEAIAVNYLAAVDGSADSVVLKDEVSGETITVKPRIVINAAGPWIDFVNQAMGQSTRFIGGTKGSHIVIDHPELAGIIGDHEFFFENKDGRIVLIFPYLGRVMIGTTDIRIDNPDEAICTEDEVDYMLDLVKRVFPDVTVRRDQIVFRFCGVRPLPASDASATGTISRDHSIRTAPNDGKRRYPLHSLVGGKWTTYRAFSEQTADLALKELGRNRRSSTSTLPIGGGKGYPTTDAARRTWLENLQKRTELPLEQLGTLLDRYGTQAEKFAEYISAGNDAPLQQLPAYTRRELEYMILHERAARLDDLLLRRTLIAMLGELSQHPAVLDEIAQIMAQAQGWDTARTSEELDRARQLFARQHQIKLELA